MHRRTPFVLVILAALVLPVAAGAHVELMPDRVAPGSFTLFTVLSPDESDQPLTGLRLTIPEGLSVDGAADTPGFTTSVIQDARHRTAAISWQGGRVAPGSLALFRFSASVGAAGTLQPTGVQTFADGSTKTWRGTAVLTVAASSEGTGRDALTIGLAAAALALSLAAIALTLVKRRAAEA